MIWFFRCFGSRRRKGRSVAKVVRPTFHGGPISVVSITRSRPLVVQIRPPARELATSRNRHLSAIKIARIHVGKFEERRFLKVGLRMERVRARLLMNIRRTKTLRPRLLVLFSAPQPGIHPC